MCKPEEKTVLQPVAPQPAAPKAPGPAAGTDSCCECCSEELTEEEAASLKEILG